MKALTLNLKTIIIDTFKISGILYGCWSILSIFITWDDLGVKQLWIKIMFLIIFFLVSFVVSIFNICVLKSKKVISTNGNGTIEECYGNLMKIAFKKKGKKIVVVSVNTCFDTIVDNDIGKHEKKMVSPTSIHGIWINEMVKNGILVEDIDEQIENYLNENKIVPYKYLSKENKPRGKLKEYQEGTIALVNGKNETVFLLVALSEFDENNNGQSSKDKLVDVLHKIINFYDKNGQGYSLFLPLMGTGLSRIGIEHEDSLEIIESMFKLHKDKIHGKVNIVVYNKDKDKISIFKE